MKYTTDIDERLVNTGTSPVIGGKGITCIRLGGQWYACIRFDRSCNTYDSCWKIADPETMIPTEAGKAYFIKELWPDGPEPEDGWRDDDFVGYEVQEIETFDDYYDIYSEKEEYRMAWEED